MLNFVKKAFKVYLEILLWVILIACAVLGAVIGSSIDSDGGFVGFLLGAIFGIIICVLGGGIIATFLKIEEHLEAIRNKDTVNPNDAQLTTSAIPSSNNFNIGRQQASPSQGYIQGSLICPLCKKHLSVQDEDNNICPHCRKKLTQ